MSKDIASLWETIIQIARDYLFAVYEPLARDFQSTAIMLLTLYIVVGSIVLIRAGSVDMMIKMGIALLVFAAVYQLVFTDGSSGFKEWVYAPIYDTSLNLTGYFANLDPKSEGVAGAIRTIQATALDMAAIADMQMTTGHWWEAFSPAPFFKGLVWFLLIAGYAAVGVGFALYTLIGFISMHVLLAVAPVMFLLGAIPMTRHFFTSWMKAVVTFALIPPFCGIILGIVNAKISTTLADLGLMAAQGSPFTMTTVVMLTMYLLAFMLLRKTPEYASAITGGAMTQLSGTGAVLMGGAAAYAATSKHSGAYSLGKLGTEKAGNILGSRAKSWSERKVGE